VAFIVLVHLTDDASAQTSPTFGQRVVMVSVDGLRSDVIQKWSHSDLPNFNRLIDEGASTLNARNDTDFSLTLPNHVSMLTGRYVSGTEGHGWFYNSEPDADETVHSENQGYIASVFDVVHDAGGRTGLFSTKTKFSLFDTSWNEEHGAEGSNGRDKIDEFRYELKSADLVDEFVDRASTGAFDLVFIHFADPDVAGHASGWSDKSTSTYADAVRNVDDQIGRLLDFLSSDRAHSGTTTLIVTADHGGTGSSHSDNESIHNYIVPFFAWGHQVSASSNLYELNPARVDHGNAWLSRAVSKSQPPVRNAEISNLALSLLDLPAIPGSLVNADQSLLLHAPETESSISFQDGRYPSSSYAGTRDTKILSDDPDSPAGYSSVLEIDGSPAYSMLLKWDLTSVAPGTDITDAFLTLDITNPSSDRYELYEATRPWSEAEATWKHAENGEEWQTKGAAGSEDRGSEILGTLQAVDTGSYRVDLNESGLEVLENWLVNPLENQGFVFQDYEQAWDGVDISSREASLKSDRPKLTILYDGEISESQTESPVSASFQDGVAPFSQYRGTRDTKLRSDEPDENFGSSHHLEMDGAPNYVSLLSWDVSSIPIDATVLSVSVRVNVSNVSTDRYGLYGVSRAWDEFEASWKRASAGESWQSEGAKGSSDASDELLGSLVAPESGRRTIVLNDEGRSLVQGWIANSESNHGLVFQSVGETYDGLDISSREHSEADHRPELIISYQSGSVSATPNSAPVAVFTVTPPAGEAGLIFHFDASASSDDDGIVGYEWDFGDGSQGSGSRVEHAYGHAGDYTVQLTVTDSQEASSFALHTIAVAAAGVVDIAFQDGVFPNSAYAGTRDTKLLSEFPLSVFGNAQDLEADGAPENAVLLKWDVSAIPPSATILSAEISVDVTNPSTDSYEIYPLLRPWQEDDASWAEAEYGSLWGRAGGSDSRDHGSEILGRLTSESTGSKSFVLNEEGVDWIQGWIEDPLVNNGLIIQDYENAWDGLDFWSREAGESASRPQLRIQYSLSLTQNSIWNEPALVTSDFGSPVSLQELDSADELERTLSSDYAGFSAVRTGSTRREEVRIEVSRTTSVMLVIPEQDSLLARGWAHDKTLDLASGRYQVYADALVNGSHSLDVPSGATLYVRTGETGSLSVANEALNLLPDHTDLIQSAYPNPFAGSLTIELSSGLGLFYELIDTLGRRVFAEKVPKNKFSMRTDGLAPGVYLLRVTDDAGSMQTILVTRGL